MKRKAAQKRIFSIYRVSLGNRKLVLEVGFHIFVKKKRLWPIIKNIDGRHLFLVALSNIRFPPE